MSEDVGTIENVDQPEEAKAEEKAAEELKVEEKPAEEVEAEEKPVEEAKVEEKSVEEPKAEAKPVEEAKVQEKPDRVALAAGYSPVEVPKAEKAEELKVTAAHCDIYGWCFRDQSDKMLFRWAKNEPQGNGIQTVYAKIAPADGALKPFERKALDEGKELKASQVQAGATGTKFLGGWKTLLNIDAYRKGESFILLQDVVKLLLLGHDGSITLVQKDQPLDVRQFQAGTAIQTDKFASLTETHPFKSISGKPLTYAEFQVIASGLGSRDAVWIFGKKDF